MAAESPKKSVNFAEGTTEPALETSVPVELASASVEVEEDKHVCSHNIPVRNFTFLTLAPITSASFPTRPRTTSSASKASTTANVDDFIPAELASPTVGSADTTAEEIEYMLKARRSSSVSSNESFGRPRFLKLGPVHWGGEPGVADFTLLE